MRAAIVAVGDELLLGDIVNANAAWLGAQLAAVGVQVVRSEMVGDDAGDIAAAVRRALPAVDVVVLTGGLGPTSDDLTRDALCLVAGVPLQRSAELEQQLREKFASFGLPMPDAVLRQADVPVGATPLDNPVGTAPGLRLTTRGRLLVALPGPPHELAATAAAVLAELRVASGTVVVTRTLHCAGAGESEVAELVEDGIGPRAQLPSQVTLAYLAGGAVVRVRLTTEAADVAAAHAVLDPVLDTLAAALGELVFGLDDDTLPAVVVRRLAAAGATVAVAESLTAGLLGASITEVAGSSAVFRGGLQVYATDLKASLAGVDPQVLAEHGAVSEQTALALAAGVRERLGADYGVALTGVAGPDGQQGHPPGTVHVAVAGPDGVVHRERRLPGDRQRVRLLAVTSALDLLRRQLPG